MPFFLLLLDKEQNQQGITSAWELAQQEPEPHGARSDRFLIGLVEGVRPPGGLHPESTKLPMLGIVVGRVLSFTSFENMIEKDGWVGASKKSTCC